MPDDWNNGLESEPVTTYVDENTKEVWVAHADELGMSLSEFVESMVNAGRAEYSDTAPEGHEDVDPVSARREVEELRRRLEAAEEDDGPDPVEAYAALDGGYLTVEEVMDEMDTDADDGEVYEALQRLLDEGLVEYDTMRNAYTRDIERAKVGTGSAGE